MRSFSSPATPAAVEKKKQLTRKNEKNDVCKGNSNCDSRRGEAPTFPVAKNKRINCYLVHRMPQFGPLTNRPLSLTLSRVCYAVRGLDDPTRLAPRNICNIPSAKSGPTVDNATRLEPETFQFFTRQNASVQQYLVSIRPIRVTPVLMTNQSMSFSKTRVFHLLQAVTKQTASVQQ